MKEIESQPFSCLGSPLSFSSLFSLWINQFVSGGYSFIFSCTLFCHCLALSWGASCYHFISILRHHCSSGLLLEEGLLQFPCEPALSFGQVNLLTNGTVCCFSRKHCIAEQHRYSTHNCFWRLEEKAVPVIFPFQSLQCSWILTDCSVVLSLGRVRLLWLRRSRSEWLLCTFAAISQEMLRKSYCYKWLQEYSLYKFVLVRNWVVLCHFCTSLTGHGFKAGIVRWLPMPPSVWCLHATGCQVKH